MTYIILFFTLYVIFCHFLHYMSFFINHKCVMLIHPSNDNSIKTFAETDEVYLRIESHQLW
jgi:hypothetical protein